MYTVILGCGRVGARLATHLSRSHEVTVIDWSPAAFERLGSEFAGETILGNGIDVDVQRAAGVDQADRFLALTNGDNRNLIAGQIAKHLGAQTVVARVYDPVRCEIFSECGIVTFTPTVNSASRLFEMVARNGEET